jgi:hypothetical protein
MRAIGSFLGDIGSILVDMSVDDSVERTFTTLRESVPSLEKMAAAFTESGPALAQLAVSAADFLAALTQTNGIQIFLGTLNAIIRAITTFISLPFVSTITGILVPIFAVTRAVAFFGQTFGFVIKGLLAPVVALGIRIGVLPAALTRAGITGKATTGSLTLGWNAVAASATRAAVATNAVAAANVRAGATGAAGKAAGAANFVPIIGPVNRVGSAATKATTKVGFFSKALRGLGAVGRGTLAVLTGISLEAGATSAAVASFAAAAAPFASFAAGILPAAGALLYLKTQADDTQQAIEAGNAVIVDAVGLSGELTATAVSNSEAYKAYAAAVGTSAADTEKFSQALLGNRAAFDEIQAQVQAAELADPTNVDTTAFAGLFSRTREDLNELIATEEAAAVEAGYLSLKHENLAAATRASKTAYDDAVTALNSWTDASRNSLVASANATVGLKQVKQTLDGLEGNKKGNLTADSFLQFDAAFEQTQALSDELLKLGKVGAAERTLQGLADALKELKTSGEISAEQYRELLDVYNLTPKNIDTRFNFLGLKQGRTELLSLQKRLEVAKQEGDIGLEYKIRAKIENVREELAKARQEVFDAITGGTLSDFADIELPFIGDFDRVEEKAKNLDTRIPEVNLKVDANTEPAKNEIIKVADFNYPKAVIDSTAKTVDTVNQILGVSRRKYPNAIVPSIAKTLEAVNDILGVSNRNYPAAVVPVKADTSSIYASIAAAFASFQATLNFGGGSSNGDNEAAAGIVLPGYAPYQDKIPFMLSPGEAVLRPQVVRALGPAFINSLNRNWPQAAKKLKGNWNNLPGFAQGGIASTQYPSVGEYGRLIASINNMAAYNVSGTSSNRDLKSSDGAQVQSGDTWIINPSPGMDEVALAEMVSRRQAFRRRRGTG